MTRFVHFALFIGLLLLGNAANAACSNPAGQEGELTYITNHSMMAYCDDTDWIAMGRKHTVSTCSESDFVTSGLIGHWKLNENTGLTASDTSGSGNNGTLTNMDAGSDWVDGIIGSALDFDGLNDSIVVGDVLDFNYTDSRTFTAWVKLDSFNSGFDADTIIAKQRISSPYDGWGFAIKNGKIRFQYVYATTSSNYYDASSTSAVVTLGSWYHVAVVYSNRTVSMYVDGVGIASTETFDNITSNIDMSLSVEIGRRHSSAIEAFDGQIDDVRIYDRSLSAGEIATIAGARCDLENGLVGHWKLDETSGTTAADSSGKGNNGTMTGGLNATDDSVTGKVGNGLSFDGTDDYISLGDSGWLKPASITLGSWVKCSPSTGTYKFIISRAKSAWVSYALRIGADHKIRMIAGYTDSSPYAEEAISQSGVCDNTWHHALGTYDQNNIKVYIDGQLETTVPFTNALLYSSTGPVTIGQHNSEASSFLEAEADDVRLYNRALSEAEVSQLYCLAAPGKITYNTIQNVMQFCSEQGLHAMGKPASPPTEEQNNLSGLVGWWKFNEGSGGTAADSSGSGNNGSLGYGAGWDTGKIGSNAINFDGSDDEVSVPNNASLNPTSGLSVALWMNIHSKSGAAQWKSPIHKGGTNDQYHIELDQNTSRPMAYVKTTSGQRWCNFSPGDRPLNAWAHYIYTYDSATGDINTYINGNLTNTCSHSGTLLTHSGTLTFGKKGFTYSFDGVLDDIRIYNRALTKSEVVSVYTNSGCTSPVGRGGETTYNTTGKVWQYCNGSHWVGVGKP